MTLQCHHDMSMPQALWNPKDATSQAPLAGLRVVDMADEKGETCGRYLADLGADVIRVESPGGSRSRLLPPFHGTTSLSFAVRNANKRGVTLDVAEHGGRAQLAAMLESADVWIETTRPGMLAALGLGPDDVLARNPGLVITSITDFGQTGDYRDWEGNDAVHAAMSGILSRSGLAGRDPLPAPRGMAYETTAIQAAWATLVAYWNRLQTGRGDHVDFSILEAAMQTMDPAYGTASVSRESAFPSTRGRPEPGLYPIFPCADGHVRVVVLAPRQWRAMRAWLGEPEAFQDERYDTISARLEASDELHPLYAALFAAMTKDTIAAEGQARGVPVAPVLDVAEVPAGPHFRWRRAFVDAEVAPGVHGRLPSGFCELDGARVGFRHRAPEPGEHNAVLAPAPRERPAAPATAALDAVASRPLAGLRVVDFGIIVIGNEIGRLLADQGADVIKIENRAFPDAARVGYGGAMSHSFVAGSRNKRSFGLNLRTPEGVALLKRLVAQADVVLENFKPGTLEKLGLDYESLRAVKPDIVMLSTNALGSTGPWSRWLGYGPIVRCVSGVASLWRYPDDELGFGEPTTIYPDHYGARVCATAVLAALIRRRRTAAGARIESAQAEMIVNQLADVFLAASLGAEHGDVGAPWGIYPCAGDDEWCVITVRDDQQWRALRSVIGSPAWAAGDSFATVAQRVAERELLDRRLAAWTRTLPPRTVMERLQAAGVPAAMMMRPGDHEHDRHLRSRDVYRELYQPGLGVVRLENGPFRSRSVPPVRVSPAPRHGEHTREICATLLGLSQPQIEALFAAAVLEEPLPMPIGAVAA
jgi:crotonobetainyl-CoA:carnitine CoA-transferase CaiB-like acyl-CoA transferase